LIGLEPGTHGTGFKRECNLTGESVTLRGEV
jgi:hypothetical protein